MSHQAVNSKTQVSTVFRFGGGLFIVALFFSIWHFGKNTQTSFSTEDKDEIESIAKRICIAANERACRITWGGKHLWAGSLVPVATGQALAGIDHIRSTLMGPTWVEHSTSDGTLFSNSTHEVFISTQTGTITIMALEHTR